MAVGPDGEADGAAAPVPEYEVVVVAPRMAWTGLAVARLFEARNRREIGMDAVPVTRLDRIEDLRTGGRRGVLRDWFDLDEAFADPLGDLPRRSCFQLRRDTGQWALPGGAQTSGRPRLSALSARNADLVGRSETAFISHHPGRDRWNFI